MEQGTPAKALRKSTLPFALVSVLIWATLSTVAKRMLAALPPLETLGLSSALAFLCMLCALFAGGAYKKLRSFTAREYLQMAGLGALGLFAYSALYYYGLGFLTAGEACVLNYLWPMMLVLFSCLFLRERLTVKKAAALLLSFGGVALLSFGGEQGGEGRLWGVAACVTAAACYGLYCVLNKKRGFDQTVMMTVVWLTVTVCCCTLGPLTETWKPVTGPQWAGLLWIGIFVNAVAYFTWALALKNAAHTAPVANLAYAVPLLSLLLGHYALGEPLRWTAFAALALIVGGILLQSVSLPERKGRRRAADG